MSPAIIASVIATTTALAASNAATASSGSSEPIPFGVGLAIITVVPAILVAFTWWVARGLRS